MSASRSPIENPILAKITAILAAKVDLPTPPLPEAIAIILFTLVILVPCEITLLIIKNK